jgi:hypothetical protein
MMVDRLASCADYLGRLTRSLAAEIASDRFYFASKAYELRDAVERLVDGCHNVERWLDECGVEFLDPTRGPDVWCTCERPVGHVGDHRTDLPRSTVERAYRDAQKLAHGIQRVGDWLAALPWNRPLDDESSDLLEALADSWRSARPEWIRLDQAIADLLPEGVR